MKDRASSVKVLKGALMTNEELNNKIETLQSRVKLLKDKEIGWERKVKEAKDYATLAWIEVGKLKKSLLEKNHIIDIERSVEVKVEGFASLAKGEVVEQHTKWFEKAKRHVIFLGFTNVVDLDVIKDVYDCEIRPLAEVSHGFHDTPATHVTNVAKPEVEAFEVPSTPTKTCTTHSEEIGEMSKKRNMSLTVMRRLRMFSYCLATSAFLHCYVLFTQLVSFSKLVFPNTENTKKS